MTGRERRMSPRKACSMSMKFRMRPAPVGAAVARMALSGSSKAAVTEINASAAEMRQFEGETINLSESGIYFKSSHNIAVGQAVELFFTLPTELTGRSPEDVKCQARVVHVDQGVDAYGRAGIGATIERFEPAARWSRNWDN